MDGPVEATRVLLDAARAKGVPIYFTTLNYRPEPVVNLANQGANQGNTGTMVEFKSFVSTHCRVPS